MAHINHIWFHGCDKGKAVMQVEVGLKPSGRVSVKVEVPDDFYDCVMRIAQTAADQHEQQMRAQILADAMIEARDK